MSRLVSVFANWKQDCLIEKTFISFDCDKSVHQKNVSLPSLSKIKQSKLKSWVWTECPILGPPRVHGTSRLSLFFFSDENEAKIWQAAIEAEDNCETCKLICKHRVVGPSWSVSDNVHIKVQITHYTADLRYFDYTVLY